jgi:hydroxymethylpyrimidine/phosphomethylpyrimidine kinase
MKTYPVVVSVAGSDSGGGAGIQADIKTISSLGLYAATVITAITAQNTIGVKGIQSVTMDVFRQQLQAVMDDFHIDAVKIGMLHSPEIVEVLTQALQTYNPKFIVLDPVMVATSGDSLIQHSTVESMKKNLFPLSTIITPNLKEASLLVNKSLETVDGRALVSVLKKEGRRFLIIVNRDFLESMTFTIKTEDTVKRVLKDATIIPVNNASEKVEIDPGDIAIFTWET